MRVLWFTNVPLAPLLTHHGKSASGSGFWMHSLVGPLCQSQVVSRLGVAYAGAGFADEHVQIDGVDYFTVAQSRSGLLGLGRRRDEARCLKKFTEVIEQFKPDVIHIHGTERFYGELKARRLTGVPTVISVQGLMRPCSQNAWGDKTFWQMARMVNTWEIARMFPTLRMRRRLASAAEREEEFIRSADGVLGRTDWDRSFCWAIAPRTPYFHVDEMMRPEFFGPRWSGSRAERHRVYTSGRLTFMKGMHAFLEAMSLLRRDYPDLDVRIAGQNSASPEACYLRKQVRRLALDENVKFLGWIPGSSIVEELLAARCYANASFIENSPNALAEAMLLGCPCVTTFTGGMPTMLRHRSTGLMAPRNCAHLLADCVREYFEDDALCESLGSAASQVAHARHDPATILGQLIEAYRAVAAGD